MAATQCLGNALDRIPPPHGLSDEPVDSATRGKTGLGKNAPRHHHQHLGKLASHHRTPELITGMSVMIAQLAPSRSRPVMTDRERRRIEDIPTGGHALQRVIRLIIHVEEHRLESPQGTIRRNPEARSCPEICIKPLQLAIALKHPRNRIVFTGPNLRADPFHKRSSVAIQHAKQQRSNS